MSLSDMLEEGKAKAGKGVEKTKDVTSNAFAKNKKLANTAAEKLKEVAGTVVEKAKEVTHKGDAKPDETAPPVVDDSAGSE